MITNNKILLIDNNDSFTFNVVELIRSIGDFDLTIINSSEIKLSDVEEFDKIIISPGPGLPKDFPILNKTISKFEKTKPILGICLGHQAINEYYRGSLINIPNVIHGQPRDIVHDSNSILFKSIPNKFVGGLYHSWVIDRYNFPSELNITSRSTDNLIMSIEHKKYQIYGVQFHPESFITEYGKQVMTNFLLL